MTTICCTGANSMGLVLISFCVLESTLLLTCGRCECLAAVTMVPELDIEPVTCNGALENIRLRLPTFNGWFMVIVRSPASILLANLFLRQLAINSMYASSISPY